MSGKITNLESKISGQDEIYQAQRKAITNKYEGIGKIKKELKALERTREKQLRCRHRDMILHGVDGLTDDQIVQIKKMLTD
jgi:hypothetical protein